MTDLYTLRSDALTASISPYGARLEQLSFEGEDVILHAHATQHPQWHDVYAGAIVGPVANRIRGGRVEIDGRTFQMARNENGITALHSGPDGLDRQVWDVVAQDARHIRLRCLLADGDAGLPGNRQCDVTYDVDGAELCLTISVKTDAPTVVSMAHHPYWRLGNAQDHRLSVAATQYLPVTDSNIPTGETENVAGTPFDHRNPRALAPDLDHNFCISTAQRSAPVHVATLTGTGGLRLTLHSTEPGLQAYSGLYLPDLPDTDIAPLAGIALEPQGWPDAPNNANFPSILCTAEAPYRQITRYRLDRAT